MPRELTPFQILLEQLRAAQGPRQRTAKYPTRQDLAKKHPEWVGKKKQCPKCGQTKDVLEGYGLRTVNGKISPQSHCRVCRADAVPRKGMEI